MGHSLYLCCSSPVYLSGLILRGLILLCLLVCGCNSSDLDKVPNDQSQQASQNRNEQNVAAGNSETPTEKDDSHAQMVQVLKEINLYMKQQSPVLSDAPLVTFQRQINQALQQNELRGVFDAKIGMGRHHTKMGRCDEGLEHLVYALKLLPEIRKSHPDFFTAEQEATLWFLAGVTAVRKAENENCVECANGESCLFPISEKGVHTNKAGAELAIKFFKRCLELDPTNLRAVWLLNVAAMTYGTPSQIVPKKFQLPASRLQSSESFPKFENVAGKTGIDTFSLAGGAVADDFDGDQCIDIVFSNWDTDGQLEFFRNRGDGTFERRTEQANLTGITGGLNVNQADYDNDGDLDLFVMRGGWLGPNGALPNSLLQNNGDGVFTDVSVGSGMGMPFLPTQASAWADFDNDGDLDLYVGNEGAPNQLFVNSAGHFQDRAVIAGVADPSMSKGVAWGDVNGDDLPDLYVSNLGEPNRLYINQGEGKFTDMAVDTGVDTPAQGFPTWFWDFDNDGDLDLYASSFHQGLEHVAADFLDTGQKRGVDSHYQGDGKGGFSNVAEAIGLTATTMPMGCNFGDLDNDGFLDFYLGTGYPAIEGIMPNLMYRNVDGKRFVDVSAAGGFGHLQKGHGVAFADFDNDGDQDVLAELGGWFTADGFKNALFKNPGFNANWIKIALEGQQSNRHGVGARIKVTVVDGQSERSIYRTVGYGSSFGGNPLRQEIGVGNAKNIKTVEVHWPTTGKKQRFDNVGINQSILIKESAEQVETIRLPVAEG